MSVPDRTRVEALFDAALGLEREERAAFVARAAHGDAAIERAVLALLAAHARADGVLDRGAGVALEADTVPERLGVYRVQREIGRGGMGVVYDAERDDGQFRRRVAIKIMRAGSDPELRSRVLAERQILAALDHPDIARLLDGGITDDGRPFLVMEHVAGLPIDVYCDRMRLDVTQRLRLFCVVARAVEFAHHNLIVHRDLKPSNVLVTADGRVKLLDFGVAKLLNAWASGASAPVTRDRLALTPQYASPEQLRGETLATTTDVYALGVMLYELLTGRRPHEAHEHSTARHIAAVCGDDVERASARVLRAETLQRADGSSRVIEPQTVAAARQTTPRRLARTLAGDIDAILAMALRPEAARRYGSAELFAQDIERALSLQRVQAHEGSRRYAFSKLIRRHRVESAAAVLVLAALLLGAGAAVRQARIAHVERDRAERANAESERVTQFLLELFEAGAPEASMGRTLSARELVDRGIDRIDMLQDQPAVQASLLGVLGHVLASLAEYEDAQRLTERALALHRTTNDEAGAARMLQQRGTVQRQRGDYRGAEQSLRDALALQHRVLPAGHSDIGATYHQLASIAVYLGQFEDARAYADEAFDIQRAALGDTHRLTVNALLLRGIVQRRVGDLAAAEQTMRAVVALRPQATGSTRAEALEDEVQLADLLVSRGRADEAERMFRSVIERARDSAEESAVRGMARSALASMLADRGDLAGAERLRREILDERRAVYGTEHRAVAESAAALGTVLLAAGRLDEAEAAFHDAARVYRSTLGERHLAHAIALGQLATIRAHRGDLRGADSLIVHAYELHVGDEGPRAHGAPELLRRRAEILVLAGRFTEAEAALEQSLAAATARNSSASVLRQIHRGFAELYGAWNRPQDAARHSALARPPG